MGVPPLLTLTTYIISFIFQYYLTLGWIIIKYRGGD
jgi:hypothetical protein